MDRPPHLDIDLNEAPSPPPSEPPTPRAPSPPRELAPPAYAAPPPPPPQPQLPPPPLLPLVAPSPQQQLRLQQEALEVVLRLHRPPELRSTPFGPIGSVPAGLLPGLGLPLPAPHPGEAGWGYPPPLCASCAGQEKLGKTFVCDACDRGFHSDCVRVWPPLPPPPPPPGPPGARRPCAATNEDWICPECEMRGARSTRWKLGPVPLDINAAPPEEPIAVPAHDISRHFLEHLFTYTHICLASVGCCSQNAGTDQSVTVLVRSKTGDNAVNLVLLIMFDSCLVWRLLLLQSYRVTLSSLVVVRHTLA